MSGLLDEIQAQEKKLKRYKDVETALDDIRKEIEYRNPDKAVSIMKCPDESGFVLAGGQIASFLHNEGYREVLNVVLIDNILKGEMTLNEAQREYEKIENRNSKDVDFLDEIN